MTSPWVSGNFSLTETLRTCRSSLSFLRIDAGNLELASMHHKYCTLPSPDVQLHEGARSLTRVNEPILFAGQSPTSKSSFRSPATYVALEVVAILDARPAIEGSLSLDYVSRLSESLVTHSWKHRNGRRIFSSSDNMLCAAPL